MYLVLTYLYDLKNIKFKLSICSNPDIPTNAPIPSYLN